MPDRQALCGILFVLHTGIQWEYLHQELGFGSGMTCWRRLAAWNEAGVLRPAAPPKWRATALPESRSITAEPELPPSVVASWWTTSCPSTAVSCPAASRLQL
ncbi:hypothetical protein GCM10010269_56460 [Streptomyces humidus]|uniref:Insertion element IS402-like domain-containing protein n=1 Tax=Streptomyces humidus TaxID=52259 RepID=A0A918G0K3_9ACTN|nr:hypothetical protein GCM10010269_56460 [Streptomyces humidus]